MQWYLNQNGKTTGPFSEDRVAMLVNWGKVSKDAYLCDDQWACWVAVGRSQFAPLLPNYDPERARESLPIGPSPVCGVYGLGPALNAA